jgi:hypothetical protein
VFPYNQQQDKNKKAYFLAAPDRQTAEQWMDAIKTQQTPIPTPSGTMPPSSSFSLFLFFPACGP